MIRELPVRQLLVVAAMAVAVLVLLRPAREGEQVSRWGAAPAAAPAPAPIQAEAAPVGQLVVQVDDGLYPEERAELESELALALAYASARFDGALSGPVTARLAAGGCGLGGIAYTDIRVVQVSTCNDIPRGRAVAILAHEFVHQLQQDRYGPRHLQADLLLSEGLATYGAGEYWLGGRPDFRSYVREQIPPAARYPLATHYSGLGIGAMNTLYYQWASFVEFLLQTYGREKLDALYVSGAGAPGSADYPGVYGRPLSELEREWVAWLDRP
jgi:hypothetical protein